MFIPVIVPFCTAGVLQLATQIHGVVFNVENCGPPYGFLAHYIVCWRSLITINTLYLDLFHECDRCVVNDRSFSRAVTAALLPL